jgi:hypothetical protein
MAEQDKEPAAAEQAKAGPGKKKKLLVFGGGAAALVASAFVVALMAVPRQVSERKFAGPFVAPMFADEVRVNLKEESRKRFAILDFNVVYEAYDPGYYGARQIDPLYAAELKDAVLGIASTKEGAQIVDKAEKPVFLEEVRHAAEPLLFPVHVGVAKAGESIASAPDKESGLALGSTPTTFRGRFFENVVKLDAVAKKISIDDGPEVTFEGHETELEVPTAGGELLYFDVSGVDPEFQGELQIGVKGRIRRILWDNVLIS